MIKRDCPIKNIFRAKSEKKHDAIVQAALKLFLDGAYETTSMAQIAEMADVSKQTIYSHFGSKESLFSAVMDTQCGKAKDTSFKCLCPENCKKKTPRELIHTVVNEFYRMMMSPESLALHRTVIAEAPRNKELGKTFIENGPEQTFAVLIDYIERENKAGRLKVENPRKAAETLMFLTKDYSHFKSLIDVDFKITEKHIEEHVNHVADIFIKIYGT